MNERIQELLEQCQIETYGVNGELLEIGFDAEKFARLIATECLDLLWNSLSISADHDGTVDGIEYTGKEILTAVKEYFGVEQ